jgi:hypothetical protein
MAATSAPLARHPVATADLSRISVFGLGIDSTLPLRGVVLGEKPPRRAASLRHVERAALQARWPREEVVSLIDRRTPSGRLVMSVDTHVEAGYRIAAPGFGTHIVSPDGASILSCIPAISAWRWQRLLFAQVVPLAATLQGLELLHASAVEHSGRALGLIAASGTGKSSIAAHLVSRGARYVADDVLALESAQGIVVAHPGPATASVYRSELRTLGAAGASRVGVVIGRSDKVQLAVEPVERPIPLDRIYFIVRNGSIVRFAIDEVRPPDPRLLLASSFISYLRTPAFLLGHLDACAQIAQAARMFRVTVPAEFGAGDVADAVERHAEVAAA